MSRLTATLAATIVLASYGCGSDEPVEDPFLQVSMEEGGFCPGPTPCWVRTVVTSAGELRQEKADGTRTATLQSGELGGIRQIADAQGFREALDASSCPDVSDFQVAIVLQTARQTRRDLFATGCSIGDEFKTHPYRQMRDRLGSLRMKYFPKNPP